ncbi:MAG: polypeptide deformylase [Chlamydiota bacterium]
MAKLQVRYYGDPILRKKCKRVEAITDEIRQLVLDMVETSDANNGIGIAAPQVGHDLALFILRDYIESPDGKVGISDYYRVYINPTICFVSEETCIEEEGCISLPQMRAPVERPYKIIIEATDMDGNRFKEEIEGYNARVRLHENDHINGVLYIDRVDKEVRKSLEQKLRELKSRHG